MFDHIQHNNRGFSYAFRDETCIYPKKCEFPQSGPSFDNGNTVLQSCGMVVVGFVIGVVIGLIRACVRMMGKWYQII